jgi:hypothetical protein
MACLASLSPAVNKRIGVMLSRFIFIFLVLYGSVSVAAPPTDEDFDRWVANWKSLVKPGAYDFVPKDVSFDLMFSKDFQEKVSKAEKAINPSVEGVSMELVGFMVPINITKDKVSSFLLVPEAGQCIHVPPPPMNQTVFVDASENPVKPADIYDPIIISGPITIQNTDHPVDSFSVNEPDSEVPTVQRSQVNLATSGYTMKLKKFEVLTLE